MQVSHNHRQSSFKALLHNCENCHKTHTMTTRKEDKAAMYDYAEDMSNHHDTAPLDTTPSTHSIPGLSGKTATEYSEDTHPQKDLVQLQEHFQQLQERLNQLGSTTSPHTHTEELAHLTEKLQKLALLLQPCSTYKPADKPIHTVMQQYTDTLCTIQWQPNLNTCLLQDSPTFDGWDSTKLEEWPSDIKTVEDILKECHACLAEAKSHGLTCTIFHKYFKLALHLRYSPSETL